MKAPPKRKGNSAFTALEGLDGFGLNESPSEKEGKCVLDGVYKIILDLPQ